MAISPVTMMRSVTTLQPSAFISSKGTTGATDQQQKDVVTGVDNIGNNMNVGDLTGVRNQINDANLGDTQVDEKYVTDATKQFYIKGSTTWNRFLSNAYEKGFTDLDNTIGAAAKGDFSNYQKLTALDGATKNIVVDNSSVRRSHEQIQLVSVFCHFVVQFNLGK